MSHVILHLAKNFKFMSLCYSKNYRHRCNLFPCIQANCIILIVTNYFILLPHSNHLQMLTTDSSPSPQATYIYQTIQMGTNKDIEIYQIALLSNIN